MDRRTRNEKIISMAEARGKRREKRARERKPRNARRGSRIFAYRKFYIAALLFLLVMASTYAVRIVALKADEARATAEFEAALEEKARLESELEHIDDPAYIEQQARTRLRMVKPGELYYVLPERDGTEAAGTADGGNSAEKEEKADAE
ncbi:MAG: septum formation initiator family protein [Clostridiales Family XIII bacterium]|jgi:cell division protein FtsB|nr:septum formation initiator family protein [Clostridiales Family XIII bacterium]